MLGTVFFFLDQPIFVVCFTILVIYLTRTVAIDNDDKITILRQSRKKFLMFRFFYAPHFQLFASPIYKILDAEAREALLLYI